MSSSPIPNPEEQGVRDPTSSLSELPPEAQEGGPQQAPGPSPPASEAFIQRILGEALTTFRQEIGSRLNIVQHTLDQHQENLDAFEHGQEQVEADLDGVKDRMGRQQLQLDAQATQQRRLTERVDLLEQGTTRGGDTSVLSPRHGGARQVQPQQLHIPRSSTPARLSRTDADADISCGTSGYGVRILPQKEEEGVNKSLSDRMADANINAAEKANILRADASALADRGKGKPLDKIWRYECLQVKQEMRDAGSEAQVQETEKRVNQHLKTIAKLRMVSPAIFKDTDSDDTASSKGVKQKVSTSNLGINPKLNGKNYEAWRSSLFGAIMHNNLATSILLLQDTEAQGKLSKYDAQVDLELAGIIILTIEHSMQKAVTDPLQRQGIRKGSVYFKALTENVRRTSRSQRELLKAQIQGCRKEQGELVQVYGFRLVALYGRLYDITGKNIDEEDKVSHFLRHLSNRYRPYIAAIQTSMETSNRT
ncbi:hypothetical protein CF319_g4687 [Tilletia indica]|nr:hypothetical protein CF319_g4687 [Tilletia indica]